MRILFLVTLLSVFPFFSRAAGSKPENQNPPAVVDSVDIARYMGQWYEIARFEQRFQKGCTHVTAEYKLLEDNKVEVLNSCIDASDGGKKRQARGKAYVADPRTNAKLRVSFFWPFYGDYWIFRLGTQYEYAIVGSPDRDSLWFLSRKPQMDEALFEQLVAEMSEEGFDMKKLLRTPQ